MPQPKLSTFTFLIVNSSRSLLIQISSRQRRNGLGGYYCLCGPFVSIHLVWPVSFKFDLNSH